MLALTSAFCELTEEGKKEVGYLKKYGTPNVLSGLFTALFMFIVLSTALGCLFNLQTPDSFEERPLTLFKEY
jgi:hypothetical protein